MPEFAVPESSHIQKRFAFIDGLRAIAALSIVIFHAVAGNHIPLLHTELPVAVRDLINHSNVSVAIFFVLSGFVITHSLTDAKLSGYALARFLFKRSIRLDPPYWLVVAVIMVIDVGKGSVNYTAPQVLAHLVYAQDLLGLTSLSPIFWTLCLELQFYVVFGLIVLTESNTVKRAAFVLSIPFSIVAIHHGLFTSLWYGFLLGAGAYMAWQDRRLIRQFGTYVVLLAAIATLRHDAFMAVSVATAMVILIVALGGKLETSLGSRTFQFVGAISYSLYLCHNLVIGATFRVSGALLGPSRLSETAGLVASIALSIAAAWLMWRMVELPSIRLSRTISIKEKTDGGQSTPLLTGGCREQRSDLAAGNT